MADAVETGPDVALQNPVRRMLPRESVEALFDGIRCGTLGAEAIGIRIAQSLRDGIQGQQVQGLHGAVMHRGDRQRALAVRAIVLRNVDAPERASAIASLSQFSDGACFLLRGIPHLAIDSRSLPPVVGRHSLYGKRFATERVGQEML